MSNKEDIEEIAGGLKNAIERGANLENARLTFINAGYSTEEIDEAINLLPEELRKSVKILPASSFQAPLRSDLKPEKPLPEIPKLAKKKKSTFKTMLLLIAVIVFILMITLLGVMFLSR